MTPSRSTKPCKSRGPRAPRSAFTLLELIVVLAIAGLLAAVAIPAAANALRGSNPSRSLQEVQSALALARAQALREAQPIEVTITSSLGTITLSWTERTATIPASWISVPPEPTTPSRVQFDSLGLPSVTTLEFREKGESADILWSLPFDPVSGSVGRPARKEATP